MVIWTSRVGEAGPKSDGWGYEVGGLMTLYLYPRDRHLALVSQKNSEVESILSH